MREAEHLLKLAEGQQTEDPDDLYQLAILETLKADLVGDGKGTPDGEGARFGSGEVYVGK